MRTPESPITPFQLERYFARWEFQAPYLLCSSDIQGYPMRELLALGDSETGGLWENLALGYTETAGHPLLREEIARQYERARSDEILCFAGAEEAVYSAMRVLLRPGDHAIVTFPGYQSLYQVAESIGAQVSHWELRAEPSADGALEWVIDVEALRKLVRPETCLIVVNFPHNPTGALPGAALWQQILDVAREAGCYLFSDEVYRWMEYDPAQRLPAAVDEYERALSLGVMSKPYGLAGLRVGWLALRDRDLLAQIASYKDYTTICNSAPSEILALIALRARETALARSMALLRTNKALVEQAMAGMQDCFAWIPPQAGSIAFPRWLGQGTVVEFAEALVQQEGVLLLPGTVYEQAGARSGFAEHFRLGMGRENLPEALARLERFTRAYQAGK